MSRWSWLFVVALFIVVGVTVWAERAFGLESPSRSPLVVPAADCPHLPASCRNNRQFDDLFRTATAKHWPATIERHWCWLKAQCCAESGLRPRVTSPANAKGMCQFLDATLAEQAKRLGRALSPFEARDSVEAAAVYMINLRKQLTSPRPSEAEAWKFPVAGYNAGQGNIWCGQRKAHGALLWRDIAPVLHQCTGRHAQETITYVSRVSQWSGFPPDPPAVNDNVPMPELKPAVCAP